jgi:hypothetical protein
LKIKVYLNNQEINWRIHKDSFPDIATSFKGDGYFDFEAEPLSFKVNTRGLNINIDDIVVITDEYGNVIINGFVDEIGDELSNPVEITVYPQSLKLKDITAGETVIINDDPENEETAIDYDTAGYKSVQEIIADLSKQAARETGWSFNTSEAAVPNPVKSGQRYFGNNLAEIVRGKLRLMEDSMHFRGKDGILYLIKIDSGFVMKTLLKKGEWGSVNLQVPGRDHDLGVTTIKKGAWLDYNLQMPPFEVKIPGLGAYYDIYRCEYGAITHIERKTWIDNTEEIERQLNQTYGDKVYTLQYGNIKNESSISAILSEMGYNLKKVYSIIDTDSFNSFALIKAHKKNNDIFGRDMLISLETSTDFYYKAHYRNKPVMDILKDLAVVTDRYLYINSANTIHLLPRNINTGSVSIKRNRVLELKKKTSNQDEISVSVNRYVENEDGEPTNFGLKLRNNEWSNIERNIKDKFAGKKIQYSWKVANTPLVDLTKKILIDGSAGYGMVTRMSRNHLANKIEFTSEEYNV